MTNRIRIIPRLDIKGPNLIKGIHLEGLRVVGDPNVFAKKYYEGGADEIIYMDIVASLYGRNNLSDIVKKTVEDIYIPITVGGGVRSIDDIQELLRSGADKVAINTAAIHSPELIKQASRKFGSQCIVLSIEAKRKSESKWESYTDNGREKTGLDAVEWAKKAVELGVGEILLTSIDKEGTQKGFDIDLIKTISTSVPVPVIASGGMGRLENVRDVVVEGKADAVSMAHVLHYSKHTLRDIKKYAIDQQINVRDL
ncbi:imidazole glycerol phosphate synthase subunit HisF [Bacteriovoracales bacterium]|nr:imidazole glycerol phosphate synthase subunit HisF [Bacteriovoracales bacterium]